MYIVVTYDIRDDKRRLRVAKCLEDYGRRVQWSVFDCLLDARELMKLQRRLDGLIDHEVDSIRFYRLCGRCRADVSILGVGTVTENQDLIII